MSSEIISEKYKDILDDGEVSLEILLHVFKKIGRLPDNLQVKCSNQMSFVFVTEDSNEVCQYFKSANMTRNIFFIMSKLYKTPQASLILKDCNGNEITNTYNYLIYLTPFVRYLPDNIIVWDKIHPLNALDKENLPTFIHNNILKLLWEIGKCINGMHQNGITHGDVSIDNIGITLPLSEESNFVLYDFDGSKNIDYYTDLNEDYNRLRKSIKFHFEIGGMPKNVLQDVENIFKGGLLNTIFNLYNKNRDCKNLILALDNIKMKF